MAQITSIKYTRDELIDIMVTIVEGGVDHWARVSVNLHDEQTMRPKRIVLYFDPIEEGGISETSFTIGDIQHGVNRILDGPIQINSQIKARIGTDVGDIDAEAADAIAQVACFGEIVFG